MSVTESSKGGLLCRVDRHFVAAAAAAGAMGAVASSSEAAIVYSGPKNIVVPANGDGIYVDLVTGLTGTSAATTPGADFNLYTVSGTVATGTYAGFVYNYLYNFTLGSTTAVPLGAVITSAAANNGPSVSKLASGALISSTSLVDSNEGLVGSFGPYGPYGEWLPPTTGFMGLNFLLGTTEAYGWVQLSISGTGSSAQATILGWGYENTGGSIAAGAVPEPTAVGVLALGAVGLATWRRRKPIAA